jgi:2-polyprenyl-3-methyl-5-hydroxy-6-metoxy-1,4-benzoquinol methylase
MSEREYATRVLGEGVEWVDGSEEHVVSVLRKAEDRSSSSDELAAHIADWPTRYHFSRLRAKILSPLRIDTETRVLDLGGGTGPLSRKLGELGAEVLLLDGSAERARVAAVRCEDLTNVSVAAGTIIDLDPTERFDIVLVVGVLEYASASRGGAEALLRRASSLLAADGVIAIGIENAIGLKYLLGYAEDHVCLPWVGWEGYLAVDHVRTYSRRELASMLVAIGLPRQAWFYPFPDYKFPTAIVSESGYALEDPSVVDAIVPQPCTSDASLPTLVSDPRAAHWTMLRAGLGRDVANSFLVVGARTEEALDAHVDRRTLAWLPGAERRRRFMRDRRLVARPSGLAIVDDTADRADSFDGWLTQHRLEEVPFVSGDPLDRLVLASLARADADRPGELLALWAETLRQATFVAEPLAGEATSPFHAEDGRLALPPDYLDSQPANFVYRDGVLARIDTEWQARGTVDFALVAVRGLFYLSIEALRLGLSGPFPASRDVAALTAALADVAGIEDHERALSRLPAAEGELHAVVLGIDLARAQESIDHLLGSSFDDLAAEVAEPPVTSLRRQVDGLSAENRELETRLAAVETELSEVQQALAGTRDRLDTTRRSLSESQAQVEALAQSLSWRVTAPLRRARRLVRPRTSGS